MEANVTARARLVEATILLVPDEGVSLEEALALAAPQGHERIERHEDGTATIHLYTSDQDQGGS